MIGFKRRWEQALADVEARGRQALPVPAGASDHPLGGHGFAGWAIEVAEQERALGVVFETIVVCSVTGSTQAGMMAGFRGPRGRRRAAPSRRRDGRLRATPVETRDQAVRIARRTAAAIGLGRDLREDEVLLDDRYHAGDLRHPRRGDARGDAPRRPPRGHDHRPRVRGEVDGGPDRPGERGARSAAGRTCSTPTSAGSRRSTRTGRCSPSRSPGRRDRLVERGVEGREPAAELVRRRPAVAQPEVRSAAARTSARARRTVPWRVEQRGVEPVEVEAPRPFGPDAREAHDAAARAATHSKRGLPSSHVGR